MRFSPGIFVLPRDYPDRPIRAGLVRRVVDDGVMKPVLRLALLGLLLVGTLSAGQSPWTQLKVGMSANRTVALLGAPVMRNHGHGFETWIYDHGAEVVIHAGLTLVGWTAPAVLAVPVHSQDIWSEHPAGEYYATMHAILPRPVRPVATPKADVTPAAVAAKATAGLTYEEFLRG